MKEKYKTRLLIYYDTQCKFKIHLIDDSIMVMRNHKLEKKVGIKL